MTRVAARISRNIVAVATGLVIRIIPKEIIKRKMTFCSHIFLNFFGQSRTRPVYLWCLPLMGFLMKPTAVKAFLLIHSAGAGSGQIMHHNLPPRGTKTDFKRNHHRIQTMIIAILWLPTGLPLRLAMINK
jgi:hypothetical protein